MSTVPHRPPFNSCPLAQLAACFASGVLVARFAPSTLVVFAVAGAPVSALALAALARKRQGIATALVCVGFFCAGACLAAQERRGVAADRVRRLFEEGEIEPGEPAELTGLLARPPEVAPDGYFLELWIERIRLKSGERRASGTVELLAPVRDAAAYESYEALELRRGARVRVLALLGRAEEFRNPGVSSRTEFLERRGLDAAGAIKSPLLVERLDDVPVFLPLYWLDVWRAALHEQLTETFSLETAGVLQAAILGNRHGLARESAERFRAGGTFHVLVISGLHVSFLGGLALWLARRLTQRRVAQFAASCALLWAYAIAVGAESSVVRAALMFTLVAFAPLVARRGGSLNALGAAALLLLAWRPSDLFSPSFQLTFLSVLGIVALAWPLLGRLREVGVWRPTRATPHPPACPRSFRAMGEALFWSERAWARESARNIHSCRLFKTRAAAALERWRVQRALRYAFSAVVVSASVQFMLLPLLVVYFHRLSLAAVLLNIFVGAVMAVASLGALTAAALAPYSHALIAPLVAAVERLTWLMAHAVDPFARAGIASLRLPEYAGPGASLYAFYYLLLSLLLLALARWRPLEAEGEQGEQQRRRARRLASVRRFAWSGFALGALLIVTHPLSAPRANGRLRVDFLDVGQGDAALLTMPDGATLLVDGGGRPRFAARTRSDEAAEPVRFERDARSIGESVVSEFLWHRGLARVDYLLATHAHADHMEGLTSVAENFRVRAAFVARAPARDAVYEKFAESLRRLNIPARLVGRGDALRFGAVTLDVLWPPRASEAEAPVPGDARFAALSSGNDDSIVLRVRYGARCFLLTGDIERGAEGALTSTREELRCDVVKVAHHGSRTSSTEAFVAAARPAFSVISVGLDSPFGHPDPAVVRRWHDAGAEVLQTGRRGTISFSTDGSDLRVETFMRE